MTFQFGKGQFSDRRQKKNIMSSVRGGGAGVKIGTPNFTTGGFVDYVYVCVCLYPFMYYFEKFSFLYFSASLYHNDTY